MQPNWRRRRSRACTCCTCLTECSTCYMHKHTTRKLTRLQTNFRLNQVQLQPVTGRLTPNETCSTLIISLISHNHIIDPYAHARTIPIHKQSSQTENAHAEWAPRHCTGSRPAALGTTRVARTITHSAACVLAMPCIQALFHPP
jgi:hypothetical protein